MHSTATTSGINVNNLQYFIFLSYLEISFTSWASNSVISPW